MPDQQQQTGGQQAGQQNAQLGGSGSAGAQGMQESAPSTAAVSPDAALGTKTLKKGSKGQFVTNLQKILNSLGSKLDADGSFGQKTHDAVVAFQKGHGLGADGVVGPKTRESLAKENKADLSGTDAKAPGSAQKEGQGTSTNQSQTEGAPPENQNPQQGTKAEPPWVSVAKGEIGTKEIKGSQHNPRVLEYHSTTGKWASDEVPWCASFVNWVMKTSGQGGTGSGAALSWKSWGRKLDKPCYGCIVVFSYGGGKGHVGFVVGKAGSKLNVLGGNQSDQVKVSSFGTGQVVAYVVPSSYQVPEEAYNLTSDGVKHDEASYSSTR